MKFLINTLCLFFALQSLTVLAENTLATETYLPLQFNTGNPAPYGIPSTIITIQSKAIPILFDTGASKSDITLSEHALKNIHVLFTGKKICFNAFDGRHCQKEFIVPEIKIGDFLLKNVKGLLVSKLWDSHHDKGFIATEASQNGVIGFNFLSQFNVLLDYPSSKVTLIKRNTALNHYDVTNWVSIPFENHLLTHLKLNNRPMTMIWDTGAIPSVIKKSVVNYFKSMPCPRNAPYFGKDCSAIEANFFSTAQNQLLPNTWFKITDIPSYAPFDGLIGSNFYRENLVYFDFDNHRIYIKHLNSALLRN
jgi:predicted aspartyl protease